MVDNPNEIFHNKASLTNSNLSIIAMIFLNVILTLLRFGVTALFLLTLLLAWFLLVQ